jgi:hypothetical protein
LPDDAATPYADSAEHGGRDFDARNRLEALKDALRSRLPDGVHDYAAAWRDDRMTSGHLDQFCEDVYQRLSVAMLAALSGHAGVDAVAEEIESHEMFGRERRQVFVGLS